MIRAIIVDDEPLVRERLRTLLAGARRHRDRWAKRAMGLRRCRSVPRRTPDLAFLDIQMPGLSGLDVAEAWRAEGRLPVIVLRDGIRHVRGGGVQTPRARLPDEADRRGAVLRVVGAGCERSSVSPAATISTVAFRRCSRCMSADNRFGPTWSCGSRNGTCSCRTADIHCLEATGNYGQAPLRARQPPVAKHAGRRRGQARPTAFPSCAPVLDRQPGTGARGTALGQGQLGARDPPGRAGAGRPAVSRRAHEDLAVGHSCTREIASEYHVSRRRTRVGFCLNEPRCALPPRFASVEEATGGLMSDEF